MHTYLQFVETAVQSLKFPENPRSLYQPMSYILNLGGKRIRPVLTLISCELFCDDFVRAKNAALAIELFHNFSLIHDDIMDNAPLRRGQSTVHEKWNQSIAILSGDGMLIEAYKKLSEYDVTIQHQLLHTFNQTATEVCEGQQMDMDFESMENVTIEAYLEMIRLKTAVLLGCSLKMGAIIAGASVKDQDDLYSFGVNLGVAFQLQDDILDLYADQTKFGKQVGGDILANKKTYLTLRAIADANDEQKKALKSISEESEATVKLEQARSLFKTLNIQTKAESKMNEYYQSALNRLQNLAISEDKKKALRDLAHFLMNREN